MPSGITIKDVAREAGCGVATVSRVLNDSGPASAETRKRVLDAAARLKFSFSDVGRSLQSRQTRAIGCLVPSLVNPVFAEAVQELQACALERGFHVLLMCSNYDPALEAEAMRILLAKRVDGMILTLSAASDCAELATVQDRNIPACMMYNTPVPGVPSAFVDNRSAARDVAGEFARAGHRRVGFLALRFGSSDRARERYEGFLEGCRAMGMDDPVLVEVDEAIRFEDVNLQRLLSGDRALTGLFASNDYLALSVISAVHDLGLTVPGDVSVVGFDGIAIGRAFRPSLATIVTDAREMGRIAADTVIEMITTQDMPVPELSGLAYSFRRGESLGSPRGGRTDDGEVAASPTPSCHPKRNSTVPKEQQS